MSEGGVSSNTTSSAKKQKQCPHMMDDYWNRRSPKSPAHDNPSHAGYYIIANE